MPLTTLFGQVTCFVLHNRTVFQLVRYNGETRHAPRKHKVGKPGGQWPALIVRGAVSPSVWASAPIVGAAECVTWGTCRNGNQRCGWQAWHVPNKMQNVMHRKFRAQAYVEHYGALFSYDTNDTKSKNSGLKRMLSTTVRSSAMTRVKQKLSDMQTHHTLDSLQTNLRWNTNHDNNVKNKLGWRLILLICMIMQTFTMPIKYSYIICK